MILVTGAVGLGWWFFHLTQGRLSPAAAAESTQTPDSGLSESRVDLPPLARLEEFAKQYGLHITSETGGKHNPGSLHYVGRAIDVSSRGFTQEMVDRLRDLAAAWGFKLRDERSRPAGQQVWGGAHLHLEVPYGL